MCMYVQRHNFVYVLVVHTCVCIYMLIVNVYVGAYMCVHMCGCTYTFMHVNVCMLGICVLFICCIMYLHVCISLHVWVYYCLYCVYNCLGMCVYA